MAERHRGRGDAARDRARRPRPRHDQPQPGGRLRDARRRRARSSARASTRTPAGRTPRSSRWPRPASGPAAAPPWSPWNPATTPAAPAPAAQALVARRGAPGRGRRRTTPTRVAAGGAATLRAAGVQVETGVRAAEAERRQHRLADRRAPGPAVRDLEVRRDAGRALGRRRRHQPVDHLRGGPGRRARAARHCRRDHRRGRHRARRRPPADRPRPARRHAWPSASRCGSWSTPPGVPRPTPGSATAPRATWIAHRGRGRRRAGRPGRPAGAARRAVRPRDPRACCWRAGRRWPARSCAAGLVDRSSATSRPSCSAPARPRWSTPGVTTIAEAIDLDVRRRHAGRARPAHHRAAPQEGGLTCSPASSRSWARSSALTDDGGRLGAARRPRPAGHVRRPARRLDRGQRRLPDRGRHRRRRLHRRRDGRDAATAPRWARCAPATRSTWSGPPTLGSRLGGHLVQGHVDGVGAVIAREPADAVGDGPVLAARRPGPVRGGEGLDHRRRHLADRRRRSATDAFAVGLIPTTLEADHARRQGRRRPGQPGGRRHRQVRRAAARRPAASPPDADAGEPPVAASELRRRGGLMGPLSWLLDAQVTSPARRCWSGRSSATAFGLASRAVRPAPAGLGLARRHDRQRAAVHRLPGRRLRHPAGARPLRAGRPAGLLLRRSASTAGGAGRATAAPTATATGPRWRPAGPPAGSGSACCSRP